MTFEELSLSKPLLQAVNEAGYKQPSPIQQKAIPPVLAGRDLLGCAQTGTGKTAAFALPILQLLAARRPQKQGAIRALVLTPTRELALQIQESFTAYGKHLPLRSVVIFGGVGQAPQVQQLRLGADVLVATPGRLNDLIGQGIIKLANVEIFVLDEADRMLDMGFVNDVKKVIKQLPKDRQTLLFSATMPKEIVQLANSLLRNPAKVFVTPPATTVERINQTLYKVDKANKRRLLAHLLRDKQVASALVFTRTKHGADRVVRELKKEGIAALAIHGNKSQNARQNALSLFKKGKLKVLVATDIAARGLDINELSHVFNYDLPNIPETYVHRIGRTGRAGHGGDAISFCCADEEPYLADIEKLIGFAIPQKGGHAWPMQGNASTAEAPGKGPAPAKPAQSKSTAQPPPVQRKKQGGASAARPGPPAPQAPGPKSGRPGRQPPAKPNPYENRTGGASIVTKRPVWSTGDAPGTGAATQHKGDEDMGRNNRRRRGGKNRGGKPAEDRGGAPAQEQKRPPKAPAIKKNERGIFDFSEAELAEDTSLRLIKDSPQNGEAKFSSFEDYLKGR